MNTTFIYCFAILAASTLGVLAQNDETTKVSRYRDVATHEKLAAKQHKVVDPMKTLVKPSTGEDSSMVQPPVNLLDDSDILCYQGLAALVPKRAILFIPEQHKSRCSFVKGSKIVNWAEFLTQNRGWITTIEVTQEHAEGSTAIDAKSLNHMSKGSSVVVATYQNGPISVLPLKTVIPLPTTHKP